MKDCTTVIISSRACNSLVSETIAKVPEKTGGILLGKIIGPAWYIIESIDPGPNPAFTRAFVHYDMEYVNHLTKVLSARYFTNLEILGHWHNQADSIETLSKAEHPTNNAFEYLPQQGFMLGLLNTEPMRLAMYRITFPLKYEKVGFEVGDHLIPDNLFKYKLNWAARAL